MFSSQYGKIEDTQTETLTEANEGNEGLCAEKRRDQINLTHRYLRCLL
jgi:hypothetical protein